MALPASFSALLSRRRIWGGAAVILAMAALVAGCLADARPSHAQGIDVPRAAKAASRARRSSRRGQEQMLVRAEVINYDYTNERVSAVGNVQIYYGGSTLEADKVIYDQKTKRLHAEGNVRLTAGRRQDHLRRDHGSERRLPRRLRRFAAARRPRADPLRGGARRAHRAATSPCSRAASTPPASPARTIPSKPPKWQVKAARIIHDEGEKMIYFEDATLEFFGVPLAYLPYFSAPDPTVKRKTGLLVPSVSTSNSLRLRASRRPTTGRWRRTTTSPSRR